MDAFTPGAAYGYDYHYYLWVCVNAASRSFEQCDTTEGQRVLTRLTQLIQVNGLGRKALVFSSGCIMGCRKDGTSVVITSKAPLNAQGDHRLFFQNVRVEDVENLVERHLLQGKPA